MKQPVLFVQGAGPNTYQEDGKLVESLRTALGDGYELRYPAMPDAGEPTYRGWRDRIAQELASVAAPTLVIGHSLGGSIVLKYLSEEQVATPIAGIFSLAAPFWNGDSDWQANEFAFNTHVAAQLAIILQIVLYHSRDDAIVPFAHAEQYAAALPQAMLRALDGRGHQFNDDLREVAEDIRHLYGSA